MSDPHVVKKLTKNSSTHYYRESSGALLWKISISLARPFPETDDCTENILDIQENDKRFVTIKLYEFLRKTYIFIFNNKNHVNRSVVKLATTNYEMDRPDKLSFSKLVLNILSQFFIFKNERTTIKGESNHTLNYIILIDNFP